MSTISISDLKKRPARQWSKSAKKGDLVVMSQGHPVAVLMPIDTESLESTLSALRSVRAIQAQAFLQQAAENNGAAALTMAQIDAEIPATRRARRRK